MDEIRIGLIAPNERGDDEISLMIRCQEWLITNEDNESISEEDRAMWQRIAKVLNDKAAFILNDPPYNTDDEDDDDLEPVAPPPGTRITTQCRK